MKTLIIASSLSICTMGYAQCLVELYESTDCSGASPSASGNSASVSQGCTTVVSPDEPLSPAETGSCEVIVWETTDCGSGGGSCMPGTGRFTNDAGLLIR
jgi:hypothetical protein